MKIKLAAMVLAGTAVVATGATVMVLQGTASPTKPGGPAAAGPVVLALASDPNAIPPAVPAKPASSFVGVLGNGVSIEVVGVSENPSRGKAWWKADGSVLADRPYSRFDGRMQLSDPKELIREVAVRVNSTLAQGGEPAAVRWTVVGNDGSVSTDVRGAFPGLEAAAFGVGDDPAGLTVRAQVAAGEWTTQYTFNGNGAQSSSTSGVMGFGKKSFLLGQPLSDGGKTQISVGCSGILSDNPQVRLVAVDQNGAERPARSGPMVSDGTILMGTFVSDLPLDSIKTLELQTRPYDQWIEIRHISLHAGQATAVEVMTSDGG